jgi:hypothetical protein
MLKWAGEGAAAVYAGGQWWRLEMAAGWWPNVAIDKGPKLG